MPSLKSKSNLPAKPASRPRKKPAPKKSVKKSEKSPVPRAPSFNIPISLSAPIFPKEGGRSIDALKEFSKDRNEKKEPEDYLAKAKEVIARNAGERKSGQPPKLGLYKKIAYSFILLVLVLLGVVFYFSFVKIKIVIVPSQEEITDSLTFKVVGGQPSNPGNGGAAIGGALDEFNVAGEEKIEATGEKVISEEVQGKVIVYNSYIKNQPLVASTRLLSSDGKLFRTKETVNVPAGGNIAVDVYADKSDSTMVIGPSKFTIPGLWAGLQDKIYAESKEPMSYKKNSKKFVKEEDIQNGINKVKESLAAKALAEARAKYPQYDQILLKIDDNAIKKEIDAMANEEKDSFTVKLETAAEMAGFMESESASLVKDRFSLTIPAGKELVSFNGDGFKYELVNIDAAAGRAEVKAEFSGKVAVKDLSKILDPKDLAGLSKAQLEEYLKSKEGIADYEIKFSPSFVKRVPAMLDRIEIEVMK
ncbi:MAG: hypothetical protein WCW77_01825 [Patescibacteria group bacterium]|jgi:hypothetical protein